MVDQAKHDGSVNGGTPATTTQGDGVTPAPAPAKPAATADMVPKADYEALAAKVGRLEADLHKRTEAKNKAKEEAAKAAREKGELAPALAQAEATVKDLEQRLADAGPRLEILDQLEQAETAWVEAKLEDLDDADKAIVSSVPLLQRRALIERLSGRSTPKVVAPEHPATTPAGPELDPTDLGDEELRAFMQDPEKREGWLSRTFGIGKHGAGQRDPWGRKLA